MATNQQSLLRQWHMLQDIPRAPSKVSVENICVRLKALGYLVTARTVQRDLQALREVFALEVDVRENHLAGAGAVMRRLSVFLA